MDYLISIAIVIWLYMTIIFLVALIKKDNSIVDVFWGIGFIIVSVYSLIIRGNLNPQIIILNLLVILWGLRLSFHIYQRNRGRGEDFRYKAWRDTWKFFVLRSYLQIFMLQGLFMFIIAAPLYFVNRHSSGIMHVNDYIGILLFLIGFYFEAAGDYQLVKFRRKPENKGKIITSGLWSITRHPNYFGESLIWWGIGFFALSLYNGWMMLISPLMITFLLRYVSGVPMLEKKYMNHPDWKEYEQKTAPFIPFIRFF